MEMIEMELLSPVVDDAISLVGIFCILIDLV